jgi:transglutaminase-like putative cysteine protease
VTEFCRPISTTTANGIRTVVWQCTDRQASAVLLEFLAEYDHNDPAVQELAAHLWRRTAKGKAKAVQTWVRKNVRYVLDHPQEEFTAPGLYATGQRTSGDCDDQARLVRALLRAMGVHAWFEFLGSPPEHVAVRAQIEGNPAAWVETTLPARLGEHPQLALRRIRK